MKYENLLFQGAESRIFATQYLGLPSVVKERFSKKYRHPEIDEEITKQRVRCECRNLAKCRQQGVDCPAVWAVRAETGIIIMERIQGKTMAELLRNRADQPMPMSVKDLAVAIGKVLATLHDKVGITHGDLTSSNMMIRDDFNSICLIDFGLATTTTIAEDRAVDLYVMERAMNSLHSDCAEEFMNELLKSYGPRSRKCQETVRRLETVRMRGRKRLVFG